MQSRGGSRHSVRGWLSSHCTHGWRGWSCGAHAGDRRAAGWRVRSPPSCRTGTCFEGGTRQPTSGRGSARSGPSVKPALTDRDAGHSRRTRHPRSRRLHRRLHRRTSRPTRPRPFACPSGLSYPRGGIKSLRGRREVVSPRAVACRLRRRRRGRARPLSPLAPSSPRRPDRSAGSVRRTAGTAGMRLTETRRGRQVWLRLNC